MNQRFPAIDLPGYHPKRMCFKRQLHRNCPIALSHREYRTQLLAYRYKACLDRHAKFPATTAQKGEKKDVRHAVERDVANATLYSLLGAAPGLVVVARTWWKGLKLESRMSAVAFAERKWSDADLTNAQLRDLWFSPERFVRPEDSAAMAEAKRAILAYRYTAMLGLWGGGILAFAGGIIGSLVARVLA